jgi:hypothetical protein
VNPRFLHAKERFDPSQRFSLWTTIYAYALILENEANRKVDIDSA